MIDKSTHKFTWLDSLVLVTLLLLVPLFLFAKPLTAQQDNRQLNRDQSPKSDRASASRVALVIGNGTYTNAPPLKNPPNDARDMAATLKALGFEVTSGVNVNQRDMKRLIREFGQSLKRGGSGLFYYAGHGVQSKGKNYLIPIEADIQSEIEVEDAGVDVNLVLGYMDDAQNGLNIVILDACRNNPFARSFRSATNGLAQIDAPTGTLIAYATAPGRVASDGTGQNGLYTSELLRQMRVPGLSVTDMFMEVRAEVMKQTANRQVPWESSSLVGRFYFSAPSNSAIANESKTDPAAFELSYWESIKNSTNPDDFKTYLTKFPNGVFAELAKLRAEPTKSTNAAAFPSADDILSEYFRALGGKDAIGRVSTLTQKGTFEIIQGKRTVEGEIEMYQKRPGKLLTIQKIGRSTVKEVFDGDRGWLYSSTSGTKAATAQQLAVHHRLAAWGDADIEKIKQLYSKIGIKAKDKIGDREVFAIEAMLPNGRQETFYFDTKTALLSRMDIITDSVEVQQGVSLGMQIYLEDYVEVNGVRMPMTVRQVQDGGTTVTAKYEITKLRFNVPLVDNLFRKP